MISLFHRLATPSIVVSGVVYRTCHAYIYMTAPSSPGRRYIFVAGWGEIQRRRGHLQGYTYEVYTHPNFLLSHARGALGPAKYTHAGGVHR